MRAVFAALPLILLFVGYQTTRSEAANVSGGVSCGENGIGGFQIKIVGEIDPPTVDKVRKLFDEQHEVFARGGTTDIAARPGSSIKCTAYGAGYEIDSPGGDVNAAIAIGKMFRKENAHLQVDKDSVCISACVLVLAGAVDRLVSGVVGIHRPYLVTTPRQSLTPDQIKDAYKRMLQEIRFYLRDMNVSERLADDMLATEPERVHILTRTELKGYGLADIDPAEQQRLAIEKEAVRLAPHSRLYPKAASPASRKRTGSRSPFFAASTMRLAIISRTRACCPVS